MAYVSDTDDETASASIISKKSNSSMSKSKTGSKITESSPLLPTQSPPQEGEIYDVPSRVRSPHFIILCMCAVVFLLQGGDQLADAPQTRIIEAIFCYRYWEQNDPSKLLVGREAVGPGAIGGVDESWCKVPAIQSQVAHLKGYQMLFDGFPSLLLAVPVGILADRIGRRPILLLGFISFSVRHMWIQTCCWFWQALDIHLSWLSSLHGLMGGSTPVISALIFVVISDVTNEANRATWFLRFGAVMVSCFFVAPPVGAVLMTINPWIPSFLALLAELSIIFIMFFIPETLNYGHAHQHHPLPIESSTRPIGGDGLESSVPPPRDDTPGSSSKRSFLSESLAQMKQSTSFLGHDWRVPVLLLTFIAYMIMQGANPILLQYASTRYNMSLSKTTLVLSIRAGSTFIFLMGVIPYASHVLIKHMGYDGKRKDLHLARISVVALAIGWFIIAFAPNVGTFIGGLLVSTIGAGQTALVRSFATDLIHAKDVAKLYTVIGLVDTISIMCGAPLMAGLFGVGLDAGGAVIGLPFWVLGAIYMVMVVILFVVRIRKRDGHIDDPPEETDMVQQA